MDIKYNDLDGTIKISEEYNIISSTASNASPVFSENQQEFIIKISNMKNVIKFTKFSYDSLGLTLNRYLKTYYRISIDDNLWTNWLDLNPNIDNFPEISSKYPLYMELKFVRLSKDDRGFIKLLEFNIEGEIERSEITDGSGFVIGKDKTVILKTPYIFKVFKINDIEIISDNPTNLDIKWRYSQDNSKTWSRWEPFNRSNVVTAKINPIRFFQVEYSVTNTSNINVYVHDVNLIGDFQNVTKDYYKTNLFGIRECCQSNSLGGYTDQNGKFIPNDNQSGISSQACSTDKSSSNLPQLSSTDKANLYNPYQQNSAMNLLEKLSNDAQQVFGFKVIYFVTDPDKRGEDKVFNEYQLYNVSCQAEIKVSVDGNNFPDSQIVMNQFDLNLFETMQVHITKQQFKEMFGPQRRPSKEDFLYFCDVNRLFTVDHAQQFRNFNNAAVYYKLILKKFNKSANVNYNDNDIKKTVDKLTKNSTIDELFGSDINDAKKSIANKDQLKTLTKDPIRLTYYAKINKELVENSSTIVSRSNYDLSSVELGTLAVQYFNLNPMQGVSNNLSFYIWFNLYNYVTDDVYNLFTNYEDVTSQGIRVNLLNDKISFELNDTQYDFNLTGIITNDVISLDEDVWYCYCVNLDQRQRTLEQWIYKRDCDDEADAAALSSTILRKVYHNLQDIVPVEWVFTSLTADNCKLLGSDMKVSNIRLFDDIIPEDQHNKLLNQYIIGNDSKHLVFADNATTRLYLNNFPYNE